MICLKMYFENLSNILLYIEKKMNKKFENRRRFHYNLILLKEYNCRQEKMIL